MTRKVIAATSLAVAASVAMTGVAFAEGRDFGPGRGHDMGGRHWLGGLFVVGALVALAALVTWLIVRRGSSASSAAVAVAPMQRPTANAEAILADRLARSEISPDDYRTTLAALRESAAPAS